jgi:glutamine amidotransferase PdxT
MHRDRKLAVLTVQQAVDEHGNSIESCGPCTMTMMMVYKISKTMFINNTRGSTGGTGNTVV